MLEESMIQASKSLTEERKIYIAQLVANSLGEDKVRNIEYKRLLQILSELNDIEILYLKKQSFRYHEKGSEAFNEKHKNVLQPKGHWDTKTPEESDAFTIFQSYAHHLVSLGLLKAKFKVKKSETPEFDEKTGMVKAQGYEVTSLGKMLLKSIGL